MNLIRPTLLVGLLLTSGQAPATTTEFCLDGEFDLGARYQGLQPRAGETYPARWCVITEDDSIRVLVSLSGRSNPDVDGSWTVAFMPPELVRIVNGDSPPDVEFRTAKSAAEAARARRMDPRRVVEELAGGSPEGFTANVADGRLVSVETTSDLPLRGRVPVIWQWAWADPDAPELRIEIDGDVVFRGTGSWRGVDDAASLWQPPPGADPVDVPGEHWPSRVAMELVNISDDIYLVQTVRTGFQHLVVDTAQGLVVADAPAGWVELHQVPPEDMVPGLGISGLSEGLIDFLAEEFPGRPIRAVALTHHHDDHAGGARAFAAAGAEVYAPQESAEFLETALNRDTMPVDRLSATGDRVTVLPVADRLRLGDERLPVDIISIGNGPHTSASLGVLAGGWFFQSDLHVPNSDATEPPAHRIETECWFAQWAVANLPAETVVINTHSAQQTPIARLARYLESPNCSGAD